jgi:hypothetical protein
MKQWKVKDIQHGILFQHHDVVNYYKTGTEYLGVSGGWSLGYTSIGTNTFVKIVVI